MQKTAVIDYGMGNIDSVKRAIEECGGNVVVTDKSDVLEEVTHIVLPGVGSFADGMKNIIARDLFRILHKQVIMNKIPFLGICLGMQLLAGNSLEDGNTKGFGWIEAEVIKLVPNNPDIKVPHMGWNEVIFQKPSVLSEGIPKGKDFYFVHSYHMLCRNKSDILATTDYCGNFVSAICKDNIFGVQFHPEKSQRYGMKLLANFLSI